MSTRSMILRKNHDDLNESRGRYHHFDGYPDGLGVFLYDLYHQQFNKDIVRMMKFIIDDHPAGWSSLRGHPLPFYENNVGYDIGMNIPSCYCHGGRSEEEQEFVFKDAKNTWCEYIYVIDEKNDTMDVYAITFHKGVRQLTTIDLNYPDRDRVMITLLECDQG